MSTALLILEMTPAETDSLEKGKQLSCERLVKVEAIRLEEHERSLCSRESEKLP